MNKKEHRQTDRQCIVSLCASCPFCLPSPAPRGCLGDCSHGIPRLHERVSCSDWLSLPLAGAFIRPVVIWIWIIDEAPCLSSPLLLCLSFLLSLLLFSLFLLCSHTSQSLFVFFCPDSDSRRETEQHSHGEREKAKK